MEEKRLPTYAEFVAQNPEGTGSVYEIFPGQTWQAMVALAVSYVWDDITLSKIEQLLELEQWGDDFFRKAIKESDLIERVAVSPYAGATGMPMYKLKYSVWCHFRAQGPAQEKYTEYCEIAADLARLAFLHQETESMEKHMNRDARIVFLHWIEFQLVSARDEALKNIDVFVGSAMTRFLSYDSIVDDLFRLKDVVAKVAVRDKTLEKLLKRLEHLHQMLLSSLDK